MYILFILVSILTFVNAAPQRYCLTGERFYCCESLKNPTFFSKVENTGKNAGAVGWNCTKADVHDTYAVKQWCVKLAAASCVEGTVLILLSHLSSHHPTCCSGESEGTNYISLFNPFSFVYVSNWDSVFLVDGSATSIHGCNHLGYYY